MKSRFIFTSLMILLGYGLRAQVAPDSVIKADDDLDAFIEDAITDIESDDQTDWTIYTDFLQDLRRKPLDLNRAEKAEMLMLPGITEIQFNSLKKYIETYGKLTTIYELQAVPNYSFEIFQKIKPYITVRAAREKDIAPGVYHPAGPGFKEVLTGARHEFITRYTQILEEQKGFTPPDTNSDGSLTSRYLGSPQKIFSRYRMRYNQNFSLALVAEKDAGEEFTWKPEQQFYGFDYLAGHIFLKDYGPLKRLVVGDYNLQVGQGMLLSSGLGFGKGAETINSVKRTNLGIRPYASVNENQFFRGAAATVAWKEFYLTGFYSNVGRDANISTLDTLTNEVASFTSLQTSGLHRTTSELEDKDAIGETTIGGRLEYQVRNLTIGTSHFIQQYNSTLLPGSRDYQRFNFSGDRNFLSGLDFDYTFRNFNFFGELGRSKSGGTGLILGVLGSIDPKIDVALQFRNFTADFHSTRGYVFAERPTAVQNEQGVYLGLKVMPTTKWTISAYFDQFRFPWHRFNVSYPSKGHEYMGQIQYKPSRNMLVYMRFRSDNKEINASEHPDGQQLEYLVRTRREALRLHFEQKLTRDLKIKTRGEYSWFSKGEEENHQGLLLFQDLVWKVGFKWKFTGRFAIFDIPDYDARIYAYENDVLGFFSIPAYSGQGTRYYFIINWKPIRPLEFWFRFARTKFQHDNVIGSGLSEIQGNTRSEIKVQARLSF